MDLGFSSTTQLAATIRAGDVSAMEVLQAHLAQIDTHNPALNTIITMDAEGAHARVREADEDLTLLYRIIRWAGWTRYRSAACAG